MRSWRSSWRECSQLSSTATKLQLTDNLSDRNRKHSPDFIPHFELNALGEVETDQIMSHLTTTTDRIITPTTTTDDTLSTLSRLPPRSPRPPHRQSPFPIRFTARKQPLQDLLSPSQKAARIKKLGDIKKKLKDKTTKQLSKLHDEEGVDTDLLAAILEAFHEKQMAELEAFEDKL